MTTIEAKELSLVYKIRQRLTLARQPKLAGPDMGKITGNGRNKYVTALDNVSFSLSSGDRLGLTGANGAGKTTLLKLLYGIYSPTSGSVFVKGRVDALLNINLGFRPEATGRRNIVLRGLINGWKMDEINGRMKEIIEFSELGDFIDMPMKSYSQGMAARLAFSVATCLEPEILLMDEWIGAGDQDFQQKAKARMQQITRKAGIVVLASHNLNLIRNTCTKILELHDGQVRRFTVAKDYFACDIDGNPRNLAGQLPLE
jgi:ABC-type polysaccharide/polyol phosphate transport system ATPase subunit